MLIAALCRRSAPLPVVLLALLSAARLGADQPRLHFHHLTVEDGLSNSWVHAILEDSHGFLWFGTHDGLNRYDGNRFTVYRSDPGDPGTLPSSFVGVLFEDSKRRL